MTSWLAWLEFSSLPRGSAHSDSSRVWTSMMQFEVSMWHYLCSNLEEGASNLQGDWLYSPLALLWLRCLWMLLQRGWGVWTSQFNSWSIQLKVNFCNMKDMQILEMAHRHGPKANCNELVLHWPKRIAHTTCRSEKYLHEIEPNSYSFAGLEPNIFISSLNLRLFKLTHIFGIQTENMSDKML